MGCPCRGGSQVAGRSRRSPGSPASTRTSTCRCCGETCHAVRRHLEGDWHLWATVRPRPAPPRPGREMPEHAEQVWVREHALAPWRGEFVLNPDVDGRWQFKRDPSVVLAIEEATWERDGIRYLRPELVLAHKVRTEPTQGRRGPRGRPPAARGHRAGVAGGRSWRATPLRTRGASGSDERDDPHDGAPRCTVPSASTRKLGLKTKSQRKPSRSATHALTPPHSRSCGAETEVAPAASAAAYSCSTSPGDARCGRATVAAPRARGRRRRTRWASARRPTGRAAAPARTARRRSRRGWCSTRRKPSPST